MPHLFSPFLATVIAVTTAQGMSLHSAKASSIPETTQANIITHLKMYRVKFAVDYSLIPAWNPLAASVCLTLFCV